MSTLFSSKEKAPGHQGSGTVLFLSSNSINDSMKEYKTISSLSVDEKLCLANFAGAQSDTLAELAQEESPDVREAVASHTNTTPDALLELVEDGNSWVSAAAQNNPNTPVEVDIDMEDEKNVDFPTLHVLC
jgi:hypothetical protein